jgi:hypothetical protein
VSARRTMTAIALVGAVVLGAAACGGNGEAALSAKVADNLEASIEQLGGNDAVTRDQIDCVSAALVKLVGPEEVERALADPENYVPESELTSEQQQALLDQCNITPPETTPTTEPIAPGMLDQPEFDPALLDPGPEILDGPGVPLDPEF